SCSTLPRPPSSTLFPYTTLFRSERDKKTEEVGRQRIKQANANLKPEVERTEHFMLFSNLPKDRAVNTLKLLETQFGYLRRILGRSEEHTSELQSLTNLVCRLLLE